MSDDRDEIIFADEDEIPFAAEEEASPQAAAPPAGAEDGWKVMIVDDEPEVHNITRLVLGEMTFEGRGFEFISASSGREARELVREHPDAAVILLDVVMESDNAGLDVARFIRTEALNPFVRIILRTGHPGQAPERSVIVDYDINDYKEKSELTSQKLFTSVTAALRSFRDLMTIETHRRRLESILAALDVAQEIQQNLLPRRAPSLPGLETAGASLYCDETGGDYFDFIQRKNGKGSELAVAVGDVSGHGISSALLMAGVRAYLRGRAARSGPAAEIITDVNNLITEDLGETGQFMTLFFLTIDPGRGRATWVQAGHDPAWLYDPAADSFELLGGRGPALGAVEGFEYPQQERDLEPGKIILIGTDGIWEAHNQDREMFGKDRLFEVIRRNARLDPEALRDSIFTSVLDFQGAAPREDDITLVVLKLT